MVLCKELRKQQTSILQFFKNIVDFTKKSATIINVMKQNSTQPVGVILHGEAMIFQSALPKNVKKIETTNEEFHIIADSETTGNHHVIDLNEKVEFYMDDDGHMYMVNEEPTQVRCVHANRHDAIPIQPGCWEIDIQEETDHFTMNKQKVRD